MFFNIGHRRRRHRHERLPLMLTSKDSLLLMLTTKDSALLMLTSKDSFVIDAHKRHRPPPLRRTASAIATNSTWAERRRNVDGTWAERGQIAR